VLNEELPIPLTNVRSTWVGSVSLVVWNDTDRDDVLDLLSSGHPVALIPRYPDYGTQAVEYLSVSGVSVSRISTLPSNSVSAIDLEAISIAAPTYYGGA